MAVLAMTGAVGCGGNSAAAARKALPAQFPVIRNNWHNKIDRVEFVENFSIDDYAGLVVLPLDTSQTPMPPNDNTRQPVDHALARCTTVVTQGIEKKLTAVPVSVSSSGVNPGGKVVVLRGTVVEMNPGSRAARYWVGMGAGSAGTRVSGDVTDGQTGRTLLRFKHGRVASGGAFGGDYDQLLNSNMTGLGEDVGVLLSAFSPSQAAKKR
jgi:hypothetical protein